MKFSSLRNNFSDLSLSYSSLGIGLAVVGICFLNFNKAFDLTNGITFFDEDKSWGKIIYLVFGFLNFLLVLFFTIKFISYKKNIINSLYSNPANAILVANCFNQLYFFSQLLAYIDINVVLFWIAFILFFLSHVSFISTSLFVYLRNRKTLLQTPEFINFWYYGLMSFAIQTSQDRNILENQFTSQYFLKTPLEYYFLVLYVFSFFLYFLNIVGIKLFIKSKKEKETFTVQLCFIIVSFGPIFAANQRFYFLNPNIMAWISFVFMIISWLFFINIYWIIPYAKIKNYNSCHPSLLAHFITTLNATFVFIWNNVNNNLGFINYSILLYIALSFFILSLLYVSILSIKVTKNLLHDLLFRNV